MWLEILVGLVPATHPLVCHLWAIPMVPGTCLHIPEMTCQQCTPLSQELYSQSGLSEVDESLATEVWNRIYKSILQAICQAGAAPGDNDNDSLSFVDEHWCRQSTCCREGEHHGEGRLPLVEVACSAACSS